MIKMLYTEISGTLVSIAYGISNFEENSLFSRKWNEMKHVVVLCSKLMVNSVSNIDEYKCLIKMLLALSIIQGKKNAFPFIWNIKLGMFVQFFW